MLQSTSTAQPVLNMFPKPTNDAQLATWLQILSNGGRRDTIF